MSEQHREFLKSNPAIPGSNENRDLVLICPVCRDPLENVHLEFWQSSDPPILETLDKIDKFQPSSDLVKLQRKMKELYLRQEANGSIINIEEEGKKFLVAITQNEASTSQTNANSDIAQQVKYPDDSVNDTKRNENSRHVPKCFPKFQATKGSSTTSSRTTTSAIDSSTSRVQPQEAALESNEAKNRPQKGYGRGRAGKKAYQGHRRPHKPRYDPHRRDRKPTEQNQLDGPRS